MVETLPKPQRTAPPVFPSPDGEINVISIHECRCNTANFERRDLYKAMLVLEGTHAMHYATRSFVVDKPALIFTNRLVPYTWEPAEGSTEQQGYICVFTEAFLHAAMRGVSLKESALYRVDGDPVYFLDDEQLRYLKAAFERMHRDLATDYAHKYELLRNQLAIIVHEAVSLQPASACPAVATTAAERITGLFLTLLDVQFAIVDKLHEPLLRNPQEYAQRLAIHINHLNRSVKEVTGKSTSTHIAERLVSSAKALLQLTDRSVGDIADLLGFGYATYFTRFFKHQTGQTPP